MSKIPLKSRKSIKAFQEKAATQLQKCSKAFGKELCLIDNTADLFQELQAAGKSEDYLFEVGSQMAPYIEQFTRVMEEFCANVDNKEQLEAELITAKVGIRMDPRKVVDEDEPKPDSRYWVIEDGVLWMETTPQYFASYISYYDKDRLLAILGSTDSMPLNTRKSLKDGRTKIDALMKKVSTAFGSEIAWVDNAQEIYDKLKDPEVGKSQEYLFNLGNVILEYAKQFAATMEAFCKDADNKEALQEVLTTGKAGVRFGEAENYWAIDDGTLWMEAQPRYFGSYMSYYDSDRLEKKL